MKKPRRRGGLGAPSGSVTGEPYDDGGGKNPITVKQIAPHQFRATPSEYELFVINRIGWPSTPKGDACRAFATATPLPSCRSLNAPITSFRNRSVSRRKGMRSLLYSKFPSGWISDA
jgi:hypothetical protein